MACEQQRKIGRAGGKERFRLAGYSAFVFSSQFSLRTQFASIDLFFQWLRLTLVKSRLAG
jgi:hypothetical protein